MGGLGKALLYQLQHTGEIVAPEVLHQFRGKLHGVHILPGGTAAVILFPPHLIQRVIIPTLGAHFLTLPQPFFPHPLRPGIPGQDIADKILGRKDGNILRDLRDPQSLSFRSVQPLPQPFFQDGPQLLRDLEIVSVDKVPVSFLFSALLRYRPSPVCSPAVA